MAYATRELSVKITGDNADFDKAIGKTTSGMKNAGDVIANFAKVAAVALIAAGAAAVTFGISSVKAYEDAEKAQAMLEHAVVDVTHATKEQLKATEDLADSLERKGVLDGDNIKQGLAQLSTFGLSNEAVRKLGGSLADLAVNQFGVNASGEQLSDTANMIAKALNGQFGILEKSGIRFTDAQKHMIAFGTEMEKVDAINQGFAQNLKYTNETALGTMEGKIAKLKVNFQNLQEAIGGALSNALAPFITQLTDWATSDEGQATIQKIADAVANLATQMAVWARDVAVPWIQQHWPDIKNGIQDAWYVFQGFMIFMVASVEVFKVIARTIQGVGEGIAAFIWTIYLGVKFVIDTVASLGQVIWSSIKWAWDKVMGLRWGDIVVGVGKAIGNSIIDMINGAIKGAFSGVPVLKDHIPQLPHFATGGIVQGTASQGDNIMVAASAGEMILNKSQQSNLFDMLNGQSNTQAQQTPVNLTVNVGMYAGMPVEKRQIALDLYKELVRAARSQGVQLPMIGAVGVQ